MQSLFGDRFLKRFVGEIRRKQKHLPFTVEEHMPDAAEGMGLQQNNNAGEEDSQKKIMNEQEIDPGSTENTAEVKNG